ncbi:serine hydrolase domain-containing protein [Streptomyces sp. NPDC058470]|uniref:serine hydrolase domain-containing protein n=1 Tax=Streptomyces sp. NPDC058470 TaxID=3346515 RepID=UPI00365684D8
MHAAWGHRNGSADGSVGVVNRRLTTGTPTALGFSGPGRLCPGCRLPCAHALGASWPPSGTSLTGWPTRGLEISPPRFRRLPPWARPARPGRVRGHEGNSDDLAGPARNCRCARCRRRVHGPRAEEDIGNAAADFERTRFDHWNPEQLVAGAVCHRPDFPPAPADEPEPDWNYSNPGYVLAGMIIERATGRPWGVEVCDRIIRPLGLTGTYAPGDKPYLKPPHAHTYHQFPGSGTWTDTTARNVSSVDAGAALVGTERDLDRFFTALLGGRLLPPARLAEMRRTVSVGKDFEVGFPGLRYGLGTDAAASDLRWAHLGPRRGLGRVHRAHRLHRRRASLHCRRRQRHRQQLRAVARGRAGCPRARGRRLSHGVLSRECPGCSSHNDLGHPRSRSHEQPLEDLLRRHAGFAHSSRSSPNSTRS